MDILFISELPIPNVESEKSLPPLVIPVLSGDSAPSQLLPIGTEKSGTSGKRSGRFFGLVTGASGSNLQVNNLKYSSNII